MSEHTPEPWTVDAGGVIRGTKGELVNVIARGKGIGAFERRVRNSRRIVACVNACKGMADPAAEIAKLRSDLAEANDYIDELRSDLRWYEMDEEGD